MRELTFRGFLTGYVRELSEQDTNSIPKLVQEAQTSNPRLKEPLLLYALYSQKKELLLQAAAGTALYEEYHQYLVRYNEDTMRCSLTAEQSTLPMGYRKVWRSFVSQRDHLQAENHSKELMRQKITRMQEKTVVTNYRICHDLRLNQGNVYAWLRSGDSSKVSLSVARSILSYLEACERLTESRDEA